MMANLFAAIGTVLIGFLMAFILVNMVLGCETWDQELWTEYNSCITPAMMFDFGQKTK